MSFSLPSLLLATAIFFVFLACNGPVEAPAPPAPPAAPVVNVAAEKEAIKAVIAAQSEAYKMKDVDKMLTYHTNPMTNIQYTIFPEQVLSATLTHAEARPMAYAYLEHAENQMSGEIERSGWNIHLSDDASMAWVSFKASVVFGDERIVTEEIRAMEKEDGEWKLALTGTLVNPEG